MRGFSLSARKVVSSRSITFGISSLALIVAAVCPAPVLAADLVCLFVPGFPIPYCFYNGPVNPRPNIIQTDQTPVVPQLKQEAPLLLGSWTPTVPPPPIKQTLGIGPVETITVGTATIKYRGPVQFAPVAGGNRLSAGQILVSSSGRTVIQTDSMRIEMAPDSMALITQDPQGAAVVTAISQEEPHSLRVDARGKTFYLAPSEQLVQTNAPQLRGYGEEVYSFGSNYEITVNYVSLHQAFKQSSVAKSIVASPASDDQFLAAKLLKMAAIMKIVRATNQ